MSASPASSPRGISVEVVYVPADGPADVSCLVLAASTTLEQALAASGVLARHGLDPARLTVGVWGRQTPLQTVLCPGDRVEIYRPLQRDPKEARRQRGREQSDGRLSRTPQP